MKSSKVIHHPGRDGEQFSTVEDEIERHTADIAALDNAKVNKAGDTMTGALTISYGDGASSANSYLRCQNGTNYGAWFLPKAGSGSFTSAVNDGDTAMIFSAGAVDSGALVIAPWNNTGIGLRMTASGTLQWSGKNVITETATLDRSGVIPYPENGSFIIWLWPSHGGTITQTGTVCASGSCTATFTINNVPLGGGAHSVSSTGQTINHSSSNTFSAGSEIRIVISSVSSCENMSFRITYRRTLT